MNQQTVQSSRSEKDKDFSRGSNFLTLSHYGISRRIKIKSLVKSTFQH